jgi:hypothetical protein
VAPSRRRQLVSADLASLKTLRSSSEAIRPRSGQQTAKGALVPRRRPDLVQRLPEAERPVADGELGHDLEAVLVAQTQEHLAPALPGPQAACRLGWSGALAVAVLDRRQLLAAVPIGSDEDEDAPAVVVEARRDVDAVGPSAASRPADPSAKRPRSDAMGATMER